MALYQPLDTIRDGSLKATIWKRETENRPFYSVELTRSYTDQDGKWHDASSFVGDELLRIARLAQLAYDETLYHRQKDREATAPNDGRRT
ncbi:MAG: hypothetical protein AAFY15_00155 [Cyanobacteria bacterium J06648_11]